MSFNLQVLAGKIRRRFIRFRFARMDHTAIGAKRQSLCLLIGPESSGTRIFDTILSQHPMILGTPAAIGHLDVLDEVWQAVDANDLTRAVRVFPQLGSNRYVLSRRSMPHAHIFGQPAIYMDFANLRRMRKVCQRLDLDLVLLITSRSVLPNLRSWSQSRLSAQRSYEKAAIQYQASYRFLFDFINRSHVPFYLLSLEALLLDRESYVQSIFQLLGLSDCSIELDLHPNVNQKYYSQPDDEAGNSPVRANLVHKDNPHLSMQRSPSP